MMVTDLIDFPLHRYKIWLIECGEIRILSLEFRKTTLFCCKFTTKEINKTVKYLEIPIICDYTLNLKNVFAYTPHASATTQLAEKTKQNNIHRHTERRREY